MNIREYDRMVNDDEQIKYLNEWNRKQKLKKNKRKEKINKIKNFLGGKSNEKI